MYIATPTAETCRFTTCVYIIASAVQLLECILWLVQLYGAQPILNSHVVCDGNNWSQSLMAITGISDWYQRPIGPSYVRASTPFASQSLPFPETCSARDTRKNKAVPKQAMKWRGCKPSPIPNLGTRWGQWSASCSGRLTPKERAVGTQLRGWVGPSTGMDDMQIKSISCPSHTSQYG
jgi:hypothetical protein